jgi:hypothetical protein
VGFIVNTEDMYVHAGTHVQCTTYLAAQLPTISTLMIAGSHVGVPGPMDRRCLFASDGGCVVRENHSTVHFQNMRPSVHLGERPIIAIALLSARYEVYSPFLLQLPVF